MPGRSCCAPHPPQAATGRAACRVSVIPGLITGIREAVILRLKIPPGPDRQDMPAGRFGQGGVEGGSDPEAVAHPWVGRSVRK